MILKISLVSFILFGMFSVVFAAPLPGQTYPYKASNCNWDGKGDEIASLAKDSAEYWCVPATAQQPKDQTGTAGACGDPNAFKLTPIEHRSKGKTYWCLPISGAVTEDGIKNIKCPAGSQIQKDINGNPIGCFDPSKKQEQGCKLIDLVRDPKTNLVIGCRTLGLFGIGYDEIRKYNTYVKIPCQPGFGEFGGTCPKAEEGPAQYIARLYQFGLMIAGLLAFGSIVYGSLKYILSAGNIGSTEEAKDIIREAIYGVALLLGAYLVLYTINPNLVKLKNPNVSPVNINKIIKEGALPEEQNLPTSSTPEDHPLCQSGVSSGITVQSNIQITGPLSSLNPPSQVPGFVCLQCKDNAITASVSDCKCDRYFKPSAEGNQCVPEIPCGNGTTYKRNAAGNMGCWR